MSALQRPRCAFCGATSFSASCFSDAISSSKISRPFRGAKQPLCACRKSLQMVRASAPEVCFLRPRRFFPQPVQSRLSSPQCDFFHRLPEVYPFIHSLGPVRRCQLQVAAYKGDTPNGVTEPTFPLTYIEKPIIINSFHRGLRASCCVPAGESPELFLESNKVANL